MSKVKIQTITPVHVGSGNFLRHNSDFVTWSENGDSYIGIIDPRKMLAIIGQEHLDDWVLLIERNGDTKEFMRSKGGCSNPEDYVQRIIYNSAKVNPNDTLKECIHDGLGRAYIPGSSIKGAIRTAVLTTLASRSNGLENVVVSIKNGKKKVSASAVEQKLFGGDPNSDIFRFLHIGDAYFGECEISSRVINLNIRQRGSLIDYSKPQIIESIYTDDESETQMKVDTRYYEWAKRHWPQGPKAKPLGNMPEEMGSLSTLFSLINEHTKTLVKDEISYWKEVQDSDYYGADEYIERMQEVLHAIGSCREGKECVLRLGHASGWRFITGAWAERLQNFETDIVPASRPNNRNYAEYDFPKSRRIEEISEYDGEKETNIFGFIKLILCQ